MGDMLQFPGNDMAPEPEPSDDEWWADEMADPDSASPDEYLEHLLPDKTEAERIQEDADHWDAIPGVVRGFLGAIQRAERIAELTSPDHYITRQARVMVRRKIPIVRAWLDQLEAEYPPDPEADESLRENLVAAGFSPDEVESHIAMTPDEVQRILDNYN